MISTKKYYTAKYDRVFKTVLCGEKNKKLMKEFLSRILNKEIDKIDYFRNELEITDTRERVKTVDVLAKADDDFIHIELNSNYTKYLHVRNFMYMCAIFSSIVSRGETADVTPKFIHIDLTYGLSKKIKVKRHFLVKEEDDNYLNTFEIYEYNMDRIMDFWYTKDEENIEKYKHLIMLNLNSEELNELSKGDEFVKIFKKKMDKLNDKKWFQSIMTREEDIEWCHRTDKKIALEDNKKDIAKKMLEKNEPIDRIHYYTGLSISDINLLKGN